MKYLASAVVTSTVLSLQWVTAVYAANIDQSMDVVESTSSSAVQSQQKIDGLARDTQMLLEEYRKLIEGVELQADQTAELLRLEAAQKAQIESLQQQIVQARITRQRIVPLMRSMAEALETFVVLDLPFHQQERIAAVLQLKQRLDRPSISVAARFRLLLEAFQIEQGYATSIEAWRGPVLQGDETLSVEFLRIGRVALYYQTLDSQQSAYWDRQSQTWHPLGTDFHRQLSQALRVAKNQTAPQLLSLPISPPSVQQEGETQ